MRVAAILLAFVGLPGSLAAQTSSSTGCDKPGVSLVREAAMLAAPHEAATGEASRTGDKALDVPLKPFASAQLPVPPERQPKADTAAGSLAFAAGVAGTFRVSVTDSAWVDVVQGGRYLEPIVVDGAGGCAGLVKSLKVALSASAFVLQFSDSARESLTVTVAPAE